MGDFNAAMDCQVSQYTCLGKFGYEIRNPREERLIGFCEQYELNISNTIYKILNQRRYTWKAPGDIRRLQIDYILVKKKFRNQIKSSHSYPGFKIDSDHSLRISKVPKHQKNLEENWKKKRGSHKTWEEIKYNINSERLKIMELIVKIEDLF
ncbi:Endonuclease/exonuclease/phosphatase [Cinara cedri]|uniref:Endonuclease/exonuclease/phosphatase n=1 Tax=Cinara cedri TaxID=506608 RepID=A0A5E4M6N0_9HEMI|nr:Endonuclease/exonuclease/phosphatase [Cinara cedri]